MAFQRTSQTAPHGLADRRTPISLPAPVRYALAGLTAAHRARLRAEVVRFTESRDAARPELGHALSWHFGVPVR